MALALRSSAGQVDGSRCLKARLLVFARVAQRVGHHAAARMHVVAGAMQMPVQPQAGQGQAVVQCVAEPGRARV